MKADKFPFFVGGTRTTCRRESAGAVWHSKPPQPLGQPRSAERYALLAPLELFGAKAEASAALRRVAPEAVELRLEEAYAAVAQEQWYLDRRDAGWQF